MKNLTRLWRLNWMALLVMVAAMCAGQATAAPSQATKDRCTAYAKRAVEQYQLMKSHSQCQANTDPVTWQDSYDNHYNGCLMFPEKMSKMADAARDNHLQACGGLTGSEPPAATATPTPTATPASPTPTSTAPAGATPPDASTSVPAALLASKPGVMVGCQMPGALQQRLTKPVQGFGRITALKGPQLSFHDSPPVTPQTTDVGTIATKAYRGDYPVVTWVVIRPRYFASSCQGIDPVSALGPWIAHPTPGDPAHPEQTPWRYIVVSADGTLVWRQITQEDSQAFLRPL